MKIVISNYYGIPTYLQLRLNIEHSQFGSNVGIPMPVQLTINIIPKRLWHAENHLYTRFNCGKRNEVEQSLQLCK